MKHRALRGLAASVLGILLWGTEDALASAFTVTPVRVFLGNGTNSALLNVRNDSTEPIRFQISLRAWNQAPDGDMQLSETSDLVFFPSMMELKAGEERKVRIGSAFRTPVATERSYRIFFEELPPPQVAPTGDEKTTAAQVKVLTKMGVPIFIQPPTPVLKADLTAINVGGSRVSFEVRNMGNSFFTVTSATLTGFSKSGATTFTKQQDGWYVLAGGLRQFVFEIPADACATTDRVRIDVASSLSDDKGNLIPIREETAVTGACAAPVPVR